MKELSTARLRGMGGGGIPAFRKGFDVLCATGPNKYVIANGDEFADQFKADQGRSFEVYGERAGDASIRMAGPEITATSVVLAAEGGPAE